MDRRNVARVAAAVLAGVGLLVGVTLPTATAAPAPAAAMPQAQLDALQRDLGLAGTAVPARLARESAAVRIGSALASTLGGSFAGSWLDESSGELTVGTTDAAETDEIRASGARPAVLTRSLAVLDSVMSTLDGRAASVPDAVTGWYVDPATNSVVVRATDPAAAESFAGGVGAIRIEEVAAAPRTMADLVGGEALNAENGGRCSIGFSATSGEDDFVITAGHCTALGGQWSGPDGTPIGPVAQSSFPENDYGLVRVESPSWSVSPQVAGSGGRIAVTGSTRAPVGASVCSAGSTSGFSCGAVLANDQTVNYGNGQVVYGLTRTDICSAGGDSGGPLLAGTEAQGVLSGGTSCFLVVQGESFFQPVGEILAANDLELVTAG